MALTAAQYRTMRDLFRARLSVDSANPTDADVLTFFKQFFTDASGSVALSSDQQTKAGRIANEVLSGNFSNPSDVNVVDFWTALAADANAGAAMGATAQYQTMQKAMVGMFACDFFNPTLASVLSYINFFGLGFTSFVTLFPGTVIFAIQGDIGVISSGGLITQVNDQSPNHTNAVAAGVARPSVGSVNARGSIQTDGLTKFLQAPCFLPAPGTTPYCSYSVFAPTAVGSQANYFGGDTGAGVLYSNGAVNNIVQYNGSNGQTGSLSTSMTRVYAEYTASVADRLKCGANAFTSGVSSGNGSGGSALCIGSGTTAPAFLSNINLVLLVYMQGALTAPQMAAIDAAANSYWGGVVI